MKFIPCLIIGADLETYFYTLRDAFTKDQRGCCKGNKDTERVVSKTERVFSSTGIDPAHEPNIILSFFIRMPKF